MSRISHRGHRSVAALVGSLVLTACSLSAGTTTATAPDGDSSGGSSGGPGRGSEGGTPGKVVLATHESWVVPQKLERAFERRTGQELVVVKSGDAGELTNRLVLTRDRPIADAVYGIDNTFASRAVDAGVLAPHVPADLPESAEQYALEGDAAGLLTPVDWGDVCVNIDQRWFAERDLDAPGSLEDLADPAYRDLFVTPGAASSSPGFAFLLATIGAFGEGEDGWRKYWEDLVGNGTRLTSGWSDAYFVDFTAGGGDGDRPIVLSYASSPPFTIPDGAERPTTRALLDTCFRQVEYAGVLAGAENPEGAAALVDFMTARAFQEALPENMYVFPVDAEVALPPLWRRWAKPAADPIEVDPALIAEKRDDWLREWSDVTSS